MKKLILALLLVAFALSLNAQTTTGPNCSTTALNCPAFNGNTMSFALTPVTLPSFGKTLSGAQTDELFSLTTNNQFGATFLVSSSTYVGVRYKRTLAGVSSWLQNHTALTGNHFQAGLSFSGGTVKASKTQWGADGSFFLNYAPNGSNNWAVAIDAGAGYFPGIVNAAGGSAKFIPKLTIGPLFTF